VCLLWRVIAVASVLWVWLAWATLLTPEFGALAPTSQRIAAACVCVGVVMPLASSVAHTMHPASNSWSLWMWRMDYCGIVVAWLTRFVFEAWFLLWCFPSLIRDTTLATGLALFACAAPRIIQHQDMVRSTA
jgi:hypothetical protein